MMVKAKTKALNLLLPEDLSIWFTDYAKSLNKTKTEIICSLLQGIQNGDAYSDVDNPVDNSVDGIESIIKSYLDNHLHSYVENILHSSKQADVVNPVDKLVESAVDDSVVNPVESNVDSYVDNHVESSVVNPVDDSVEPDALPIIEAIATIEAPMIENPLPDNALSEAIAASAKPTKKQSKSKKALSEIDVEQAYEIAKSRRYGGSIQSFKQDFSRQKEAFGQKYGLERWKKEEGHTKPYSYRDIL